MAAVPMPTLRGGRIDARDSVADNRRRLFAATTIFRRLDNEARASVARKVECAVGEGAGRVVMKSELTFRRNTYNLS